MDREEVERWMVKIRDGERFPVLCMICLIASSRRSGTREAADIAPQRCSAIVLAETVAAGICERGNICRKPSRASVLEPWGEPSCRVGFVEDGSP